MKYYFNISVANSGSLKGNKIHKVYSINSIVGSNYRWIPDNSSQHYINFSYNYMPLIHHTLLAYSNVIWMYMFSVGNLLTFSINCIHSLCHFCLVEYLWRGRGVLRLYVTREPRWLCYFRRCLNENDVGVCNMWSKRSFSCLR